MNERMNEWLNKYIDKQKIYLNTYSLTIQINI